jgi:hypothetical protein
MPLSAATYSATYLDPPSGVLRTALKGKDYQLRYDVADGVHKLADNIGRLGYSAATAQAIVPAYITAGVTKAATASATPAVLSDFLLIDSP